jgi:co-chaperonin GroES (HSP10)
MMPDICLECGGDVLLVKDVDWEKNKIVHTAPLNEKLSKVLIKYNIPFRCKSCGSLKFPYQATLDRVFVFPDPIPEKVGLIYLPDILKESHQNEYAVVLSVGKGYVHKIGRYFIPTTIQVGDRVVYDKSIMWQLPIQDSDGKVYNIKYMGENDIQGTVEE